MAKRYDLLIVGAGLFGAACAYELARRGLHCLVIDRRDHIGGNCFTEQRDGINIHRYGPHIFHTSDKRIWEWINQFASFNHYRHRVKVNIGDGIYSFPLNLMTFHQLWGVKTPVEARAFLNGIKIKQKNRQNIERWLLSEVGSEIYEKFFKGYTHKQWGKLPSTLPSSIVKRLPIRFTYDDNYFDDTYQGIPIGGYTRIFSQLLKNADVRLNTDYFSDRQRFDDLALRVLYTGPIDRFFDFRFGELEYRSLRFEHTRLEIPDFQGVAQMNFSSNTVPFTRIIEHKHFEFGRQPVTWISKEYSLAAGRGQEPIYPVKDEANKQIWESYRLLSEAPEYRNFFFGGRLAAYQYYDMHQIIAAALLKCRSIEKEFKR